MSNGNGRKPRLELTWIGKDERPRLEPRILLPVPEQSHSKGERGDGGIHDNMLIRGDNLLALRALEQQFAGKVKCVFIDPPYNTGSAFVNYDDGLEHSLWLNLIRDRLELLRRLLADDGSLWITIDDTECHYLKVLCDEVFGRQNFVANVVWEKAYTANQTALHISNTHDHVLVYARDTSLLHIGKVGRTADQEAKFSNRDERGAWKAENLSAGKFYSAGQFEIVGPHGDVFLPPKGRYWRCNETQFKSWLADNRITFGRDGRGRPMLKKYLNEMPEGLKLSSWWTHKEAGSNKEASIHLKKLLGETDVFETPKPEKLIARVLEVATKTGDIVLDSFAGSGTTGAVAHKMGRRWIMVELGDHATTHVVPRLKKVIDGEDPSGVTESCGWKGGGGFRTYRLAPSLIETDQFGQKVISKQYNAAMLAEAMCKHMNFTYAPSHDPALYWQHGHSTESDFIFITTLSLSHDALQALSLEVGEGRTLKICCKAFRARLSDFPNLTVGKIPQAVLANCEWGRDDYSLNIVKPADGDGGVDTDGNDDNGSGEPEGRPRGQRKGTIEAEPVAVSATARKAPLKMDGTTRAPRAARPPIKKTATAAALPPPADGPAKPSRKRKEVETPVAPTSPAKIRARAVAAKRKPSGKDKSRRSSDARQGRLL